MPLAISAITNSFASRRPESKSLSDVRTSFLSPGCKPDCVREWSLNLLLKIELPFLVPVCGNCIQGVPSTFYIPAVKVNNYPHYNKKWSLRKWKLRFLYYSSVYGKRRDKWEGRIILYKEGGGPMCSLRRRLTVFIAFISIGYWGALPDQFA